MTNRTQSESMNENWFKDFPSPKEELKNQIIDGPSFLSLSFTDPQWLVKNYIPMGGLTMLASAPGNWKTWLTLLLIKAVTSGTKWMNQFDTIQGNVLLINEEDVPRNLQNRMKKLDISGEKLFILSRKGVIIDDPSILSQIKEIKKENNIKLIIIDNLALVQEKEENSSVEVSKLWKNLRGLTEDGCALLTVHHFRKKDPKAKLSVDNILLKEMARGSNAHIANQDSFLAIDPLMDERDGSNAFVVYNPKNREVESQKPFKVIVKKPIQDTPVFEFAGLFESTLTAIDKTMDLIMDSLASGKPMTIKQFVDAGCGIEKTIRTAISIFKSQHKVIEKKAFEFGLNENKKTKAYILNSDQEQSSLNQALNELDQERLDKLEF